MEKLNLVLIMHNVLSTQLYSEHYSALRIFEIEFPYSTLPTIKKMNEMVFCILSPPIS